MLFKKFKGSHAGLAEFKGQVLTVNLYSTVDAYLHQGALFSIPA
jgi:hypothetical protein